jgi:F-type H+-transporting ATPase subunit delta
MASSTRQALQAATAALTPLLKKADLKFAEELLSIGVALSTSVQLRNILSDPSGAEKAKSGALKAVFGKKVSAEALAFAQTLSGLRWSKGGDLVAAFEQLGVYTVASIAAGDKKLEALETDLFGVQQLIDSDEELQQAFSSRQASTDSKVALIQKLTAKKVGDNAALLVRFAVAGARHRRLSLVLEGFIKQVSAVAERLVATVTVAAPLEKAMLERLEKALSKTYGQALNLNVEIDPSVVGGVKVQVSGEIIDGSIATRLNQARMQLA